MRKILTEEKYKGVMDKLYEGEPVIIGNVRLTIVDLQNNKEVV